MVSLLLLIFLFILFVALSYGLYARFIVKQPAIKLLQSQIDGFTSKTDKNASVPRWVSSGMYLKTFTSEVARHVTKCRCLADFPLKKKITDHYAESYRIMSLLSIAAKSEGAKIVDANFMYVAPHSRLKTTDIPNSEIYDYELCLYSEDNGRVYPYSQSNEENGTDYFTLKATNEKLYLPHQDRLYVNQTSSPCLLLRISFKKLHRSFLDRLF